MINVKGVIQNNKTASDFIKQQRKFNDIYRILSKEDERAMIEGYTRLVLGEDGKPKYDKDFNCEFEWIGDETELRLKLAMHNLRAVTKISTKHCQDTRDFDNMYAKGLFGLTRAANEFHPYKLITKVVGYTKDENGKKVAIREVKPDKNGNIQFVKFNTLAQWWIFKYVVDEFYQKSIYIDNNSLSLNELARIHGKDAGNMTLENFIQDNIAPEITPKKTVTDEISSSELSNLYESIHEYIETAPEISSVERSILEETFYNGTTNIKKLSSILKIPQQTIIDGQVSALGKLKDYLYEEYGIESLSDVI